MADSQNGKPKAAQGAEAPAPAKPRGRRPAPKEAAEAGRVWTGERVSVGEGHPEPPVPSSTPAAIVPGEAGKPGQGVHAGPAGTRKARNQSGWIPAEGGPLTVPAARQGPTFGTADDSRFAVEAQEVPSPAFADGLAGSREHDLARKLHELLASPLGEGVALIVEESYRMLPLVRPST